jgi:hypothetical protein
MNHLIDDYDWFGVTPEYCCGCSYCGNSTLILENLIFIASLEMLLNLIRVLTKAKGREEFKRARRK